MFVFVAGYNGLVRLRNRIDNAWSQIGVQLERRHDLIPNLIETVKGYAAHEKSTLRSVVAARNSAIQAQGAGPEQQAQAENVLTGALKNLFALAEAYPDLKANRASCRCRRSSPPPRTASRTRGSSTTTAS